jgi:hypothetical protein
MIKLLNLLVDTTPGLNYHLQHGLPLSENVYRYSSDAFLQLFTEARNLHRDGYLQLCEADRILLEETNIGEYGLYEGQQVPLDLPMVDKQELDEAKHKGQDVQLNKPKRGGPKKFYVYVKDPKTKNIKKVNFGDSGNLTVKLNEPGARAAFAARHKCAMKKDRTSPGYWSCNIGRYWKSLGGAKNFSGYW